MAGMTAAEAPVIPPTNGEIGRRIGATRAAVSRWLGGSRCPRMETRKLIAQEFGWSVGAQADAEARGEWAEGFLAAVCAHYGIPSLA